jgi:succinate dehydrogenase hydrophobic membrane anchor protein
LKGALQWFLQRLTGVVLFAGLIIHFYVMHYSGTDQLAYESVIKRISSPYWKAFDIVFLISILYHGLNGLWGIVTEYVHSIRLLKVVRTSIILLAFIVLFTGVYIIQTPS